jgi:hypothetical protein
MYSIEDVHQCSLTSSVLSEKPVNLSRSKLEVDVIVRNNAGKSLHYSLHLNKNIFPRQSHVTHVSPPVFGAFSIKG